MALWYVSTGSGEPAGPFPQDQLDRDIRAGELSLEAIVCVVGSTEWSPVASMPQFAAAIKAVAPPPPLPVSHYGSPPGVMSTATQPHPSQMSYGFGGGPMQQTFVPSAVIPDNAQWPMSSALQPANAELHPGSRPGVNVAVALTALASLFWLIISFGQAFLLIVFGDVSLGSIAVRNFLAALVFLWLATALWRRKRSAYAWGLAAHISIATIAAYHTVHDAPLQVLGFVMHVISAVLIWNSRSVLTIESDANLRNVLTIENDASPSDGWRIVYGLIGIVMLATAIMVVIGAYLKR